MVVAGAFGERWVAIASTRPETCSGSTTRGARCRCQRGASAVAGRSAPGSSLHAVVDVTGVVTDIQAFKAAVGDAVPLSTPSVARRRPLRWRVGVDVVVSGSRRRDVSARLAMRRRRADLDTLRRRAPYFDGERRGRRGVSTRPSRRRLADPRARRPPPDPAAGSRCVRNTFASSGPRAPGSRRWGSSCSRPTRTRGVVTSVRHPRASTAPPARHLATARLDARARPWTLQGKICRVVHIAGSTSSDIAVALAAVELSLIESRAVEAGVAVQRAFEAYETRLLA